MDSLNRFFVTNNKDTQKENISCLLQKQFLKGFYNIHLNLVQGIYSDVLYCNPTSMYHDKQNFTISVVQHSLTSAFYTIFM
jgi:hypothetical protein